MADETPGRARTEGWDRTPSSDPTSLTTAALLREIATLKEQVRTELLGEVKVLEAKIQALEKTAVAAHEDLVRVPTAVDRAVDDLRALHDERFERIEVKFQGVQTQIAERDIKVTETSLATSKAIDAALAAAEKARTSQAESAAQAAAKSESGFARALDQQSALAQTTTGAIRDQLEDLKSRVTRIEAVAIGQSGQKTEQNQSSGLTIAVISIGVTILLALLAVFSFIQRIPAAR